MVSEFSFLQRVRTYRNEQIRRSPLVLLPSSSILLLTPLDIPVRAMHNHKREEYGIEPWERAVESSDQTPAESKVEIGSVVDLAGVLEPAVDHERISRLGADDFWVLDLLPWELRESVPVDGDATLIGAEHVLLRIASIPDPVSTLR